MKKTPKLITGGEVINWKIATEVRYAYSSREAKSLSCSLDGIFIVRVGGLEVCNGRDAYDAATAYNVATDEYIEPYKDFTL